MPSSGGALTPLLEQYEGVKAQYPGHLVLIRVGDFYEAFGDDAKLLSKELEIVLTARAPDTSGERTPMAGVPHHAVESYLGRLLRRGHKIAVVDQVEDARFAKGLVRREVTRVVTPGTVVDERILPGTDHNFLAALVARPSGAAAFAAVDITTGEWYSGAANQPGAEAAVASLAPFNPREILFHEEPGRRDTPSVLGSVLRREFPLARLEPAPPPLDESMRPERLAVLPGEPAAVAEAEGRLAAYVRASQPRLLPYLERVAGRGVRRLPLDGKTLRHLEIIRPMNPDDPSGPTLLGSWDRSVTAPGHRALAHWLRNPLADVTAITGRLDAVEHFAGRGSDLAVAATLLRPFSDVARIGARIAGRRVRASELGALRESVDAVEALRAWLVAPTRPRQIDELYERLDPVPELRSLLAAALADDLPPTVEGAGLFRKGYDRQLDGLRKEEEDALARLEELERRERDAAGIRGLKVGYNQVFGYYFEVSKTNLGRVPAHFRRKQTLAQGERFTTDELSAIETTILSARDRLATAHTDRFERFLGEVESFLPRVNRLARAVGELDALVAFARLAQERGLVRPEIDDHHRLQIRDGRHPVLDRLLTGRFVPNDTDLDADGRRLLVLTGPNMSGKSTYMRQVGLLVVLAQAGSFVPAKFARIGLVTSLFTRMGFTDEIGRGKSSFLVEMSEVAEILRACDAGSLVLLDEVGRGTSTFDGLALAWATLRHLHDGIGCRTVLATHYHQLTDLVVSLPGAATAHMAVRESGDEIVFLHHLVPGGTDRSYGLHVARLAGLPPEVIKEADRLLKRLEAESTIPTAGHGRGKGGRYTQAILLAEPGRTPSGVETALAGIDPDRMTPLEAHAWLVAWRKRLAEGAREGPS
ncbi:MAG: DNA mismatch repair protein MutS [Thermoplasmata archaeon]|nr:DNA mismatch repair protein MutS [Thermoplasmata archaeon]